MSSGVLLIADDGTPIDDDEGTLSVFDEGSWSPVCTQSFAMQTMHTLCRYMGWPRGLYNQLIVTDPAKVLNVVQELGPKKGRSLEEVEGHCSHVSLACDPSACGRRPLYLGIDQVPKDAVAAWPWAANLFVEDEQVCGATLVHAKFILTELECATKVTKSDWQHVVVLVGQERRTRVGLSPWAQVRRVVSLKKLPNSAVVLGQLESAVNLGERVSPLCLPPLDFELRPSTKCVLTGPNQHRWTTALEVERIQCKLGYYSEDEVCIEQPAAAGAGVNTKGWAGALACPDSSGRWMAVAAYYSAGNSPPTVMTSLLSMAVRESTKQLMRRGLAMPRYPPPDECAERRCVLGRCLEEERVCDRIWDCQDGEDELGCDYTKVNLSNFNVAVACQPESIPGEASSQRLFSLVF